MGGGARAVRLYLMRLSVTVGFCASTLIARILPLCLFVFLRSFPLLRPSLC